ncbi:YeeE/YedE family protein [Allopusillimonas soli]|uniref:YeeE/YedE family protein n=1 Tax=Allopusillimonas soli TaxID=659016 RepID=A0A853FGM2_9BURK|nr:YeeE/YedE thiosulfate transporter family protein [Allopusillimonas soli]NYT39027.1 YeeE/YedE family protein [Allopusillimonas soli]TEA69537.1 YeeE/YedE family protein [Allopusillimonas soli]
MNRCLISAAMAVFFFFLAWAVSLRQALLFLVGIGLGGVLAGARFGFTTGWRLLIENRDASGVMAQLFLLGLAAAVCMPLLAAFPGELGAALGPPSYSLLIGAFVFGLAMQVADGCGSGTLYKAGLGIPLNMGILPIFALGSFLGSAQLEQWLQLGSIAPVGLVARFGLLEAFGITLLGLIALGWAALRWSDRIAPWFNKKLFIGAMLLAVLAALNLIIAGQPWGIVYGFGLWGAKAATALGVFDPTANAFWSEPVNVRTLSQSVFLDVTSITNIGILAGALWIAAKRKVGAAEPRSLTGTQWVVGIAAGFLLGYSSRLAFGCNIGAMVSGISTGSLHGWIWVPMAFMGSLIGVRVRRRFNF